jgi:Protein of unknown function (DUF1552)
MSMLVSRRALLAGLGGTALTFPLLSELSRPLALAAGAAPQRYIVMFGGMSPTNGWFSKVVLEPDMTPGSPFLQATAALDARGVRNKVSFVTGMNMARDLNTPGGMGVQWHRNAKGPLISGVRGDGSQIPRGTTSDQTVADAFAHPTFARGIHYRVQYQSYDANGAPAGVISGRFEGGGFKPNEPAVNAALAYKTLAAQVSGGGDAAAQAKAAAAAARTKSSIAYVRTRGGLLTQLPAEDRLRLQQHMDELSSYEKALSVLGASQGQCTPPKEPTDDTTLNGKYAFEKERAPLLCDLIKFAFSCNLARVATLCVTHEQSFLGTRSILPSGIATDMHELSHSDATPNGGSLLQAINWHVDVFAYLVKGLASTPDVDGRTLLDNTSIVYLFEGGKGFDPEVGDATHASENMVALVAGRAAGKLPGGSQVKAAGKHPASVLLTAMKNVGVNASAHGEIKTTIAELVG